MRKKCMNHIIKTTALVVAGVLSLSVFETEAAKVEEEILIPEDTWAAEYADSLELQSYVLYTQEGDVRGEFTYNESGELYLSKETLEYEDEDGYWVKKIWEVRPSNAYADVRLYTYRYQDDKTLCYMDKYENGVFDYGRGWVWSAEGALQLYVKYDAERNVEAAECTYYDEEGRQAYVLSGLSDLEAIEWNEANIYSYECGANGVITGYMQEGKEGLKTPFYRQEVMDEQVLLEMEYTERTVDSLVWNAHDEEGRVICEISAGLAWRADYSEIKLAHYIYDEQGTCIAKYDYNIVDDIFIQNTESKVDPGRSFEATFGANGYPGEIVSECALTDRVVIQYHNDNGALKNLIMGDE